MIQFTPIGQLRHLLGGIYRYIKSIVVDKKFSLDVFRTLLLLIPTNFSVVSAIGVTLRGSSIPGPFNDMIFVVFVLCGNGAKYANTKLGVFSNFMYDNIGKLFL